MRILLATYVGFSDGIFMKDLEYKLSVKSKSDTGIVFTIVGHIDDTESAEFRWSNDVFANRFVISNLNEEIANILGL